MKLDAIAEAHPQNILQGVFREFTIVPHFYFSNVDFFSYIKDKPEFMKDPAFWNSLKAFIEKEARDYQKRKKQCDELVLVNPPLYSDSQFERLLELTLQRVDISRRIWEEEIDVLKKSLYKNVFLEGAVINPVLDSVASELGSQVVYLDVNNTYYELLRMHKEVRASEKDEWQSQREGVWVERIKPKLKPEEQSIMVVGLQHLNDDFGLVGKLKGRDVEIRVVKEFNEYSKKVDVIAEEMNDVEKKAMQVFSDALKGWH